MKKLNKKGFTLVELLAVIVILAILMVVAGTIIPNIQETARHSACKSEAQKLSNQIVEDYQLWLTGNATNYEYSGGEISKASTGDEQKEITMKDKNFTMIAKFDGTKVTSYCISDEKGTVINEGSYDSEKAYCTDSATASETDPNGDTE